MTAIKQLVRRSLLITSLAAVIIVGGLSAVHAQPVLPTDTNNYPPPTQEELDAAYAAWLAKLSNNLASVSGWLHNGITNSDGSPVESIQTLTDNQTMSFSSSGTFSWQSSSLDEALTWATAVGIPTKINGGDAAPSAYLVGRENNVPIYLAPFDLAAAITIDTTNVWPGAPTGFSLTGTNTTVSQWDEGSPRLSHSEFGSRVARMDGTTNLSDHSTAVAGIIGAAGANIIYSNGVPIGYAAKGMAYTANVQTWSFLNGDLAQMTGSVGTNQMRLSNHSYGAIAGWYLSGSTWYWFGNSEISTNQDPKFGNYTTNSSSYDLIAQNAPTYLQVWAAGNDQGEAPLVQPTNHIEFTLTGNGVVTNRVHPADGDQGYDTMSQQASAKDVLTVGAVNSLPNGYSGAANLLLASFSSCGPTDDGRIKPDVVGDGVNNIVAVSGSDFAYAQSSGTSFAAPSVTGSIDLLMELYRQRHAPSSDPLSSSIKGLVIHTADSGTTNNGPSYRFGWGLMNTRTAAALINQDATNGLKNQIKEVLLPNGHLVQFPVISAGTNALKVTICWTDPPGVPNSITNLNNPAIKLVNDLDLRIYSPNGATNLPWILNPDLTNRTAAARSAVATRGDDNRNNVEQVYIPNPAVGTYLVTVTHKGTLTNSQWASILVSGNVAQLPPQLAINQILQTGTNTIAVGWPAVVGGQYQIQMKNDLTTTNWSNVGGVISARLTNVVEQVPMNGSQSFYRLIQLP